MQAWMACQSLDSPGWPQIQGNPPVSASQIDYRHVSPCPALSPYFQSDFEIIIKQLQTKKANLRPSYKICFIYFWFVSNFTSINNFHNRIYNTSILRMNCNYYPVSYEAEALGSQIQGLSRLSSPRWLRQTLSQNKNLKRDRSIV